MKSVFTLNPFIERLLSPDYDIDKLINAVQASLNSASITQEKSNRGNVRLVTKGAEFKFSEGNQTQYLGKTDEPAKFVAWHDAQAKVFKVCGEPSDELSKAIIPASRLDWLDRKFKLNPTPAAPAKRNGKRNGNLESVETPAAPAA